MWRTNMADQVSPSSAANTPHIVLRLIFLRLFWVFPGCSQSSLWRGPSQTALLSGYRLRSAFIALPSGWEAQLPEQYKSII